MKPRPWFLVLLWLGLWLWPGIGHGASATPGAEASASSLRVDLVTVGRGTGLFTRGGHTALAITETRPDGRVVETVYNYGDTNFEDPLLAWHFVAGDMDFFVSVAGDLYDVAERYGLLQDRDVVKQRLALSQAQAKTLSDMLELEIQPDNRTYRFHHLEHLCSTEIRDRLDTLVGGEIQRQLADTDPWTVRDIQHHTFNAHPGGTLIGDLFYGRRHDLPIDRYYALLMPERMRDDLQTVMVPDPDGGDGLVPFAGEPEVLAARGAPPWSDDQSSETWVIAIALAGVGIVGGFVLARRGTDSPRSSAAWLVAWSLPIGLGGLGLVLLPLVSSVPELHDNELVVSWLVTDLALVPVAVRWWRKGVTAPAWVWRYAQVRLVVVTLAVAARAGGVFIQQPWILPVASLGCSLGLWWFVRNLRATAPDAHP
ncbi:MAG: DUF4105 domain-containing protein [Myxococcota bacterium]